MYADAESALGRMLISIAAYLTTIAVARLFLVEGCDLRFCSAGCALTRPLLGCGGAVCADGQDSGGSHGGADRVLLTPQGTEYRAHRVRARRIRGRAIQGGSGLPSARAS